MNAEPHRTVIPASWPKGWVPPAPKRSDQSWKIFTGYLLASLVALPVLRYVSLTNVPFNQQLIAYAILLLCGWPAVTHLTRRQAGLPVFAIICLVYGAGYALPIFTTKPIVMSVNRFGFVGVSAAAVTEALWLTLLGVFSMQVGFWLFKYTLLNMLIPKVRIPLNVKKARRLALVLGTCGAITLWMGINSTLQISVRFVFLYIIIVRLALLSIGLLYWYYLKGELTRSSKAWFIGIVLVFVMLGLALGNFRSVMEPMMVILAVHWMLRRQFPWKMVLVGILLFGIMQPIKGAYRALVWRQGVAQTSVIDRMGLWVTLVRSGWTGILSGRHGAVEHVTRDSLNRTDFIHMFAHVVDETPRHVPFQHGHTYSYLLVTLIPRLIWPDKPSAQVANDFFGVSYGFQSADSLGTTSIGMPHLVETYINFGVMGAFFVMMMIGMVYAAVERLFAHAEAKEGEVAAYAVVMTMLLTIETATAPSFGALIQTIVILILTLRWARQKTVASVWQV